MPPNPEPSLDEMRLALAQKNRVPGRNGAPIPAEYNNISYPLTHGLVPMVYGAAKGTLATIPGVVGDVNELLRDYLTPHLPKGVQDVLAKAPAPYTTEQYVNMMPKMGGHTEDVATKLGSNVVGAMVDPFAAVGALKRAPAAGRALVEAANQRIMQGKSLIPGVPASMTNPPMMFAVKPEANLNFQPSVLASRLKGPETQPVQNFLQQAKSLQGVTKEGLKNSIRELELLDPTTKITKEKFANSFAPSRFEKVELKGAAGENFHGLEEAEEYARNDYIPTFEYVADRLGISVEHVHDLNKYFSGEPLSELHIDVRKAIQKTGMTHSEFENLVDEGMQTVTNQYMDDMGYHNKGQDYQYAGTQRLAGRSDEENLGGYFEFGVSHPEGPNYYRHYNNAPEGTVGHVRGTFLDDFIDSYPGAGEEIKNLPNPKPKSMLIEEIQSDANKVSDQTGPLHQIHGTLFKAAVQHALQNGADTVYLPTAKTISEARHTSPERFAPIYDQQIIREGLNPLKRIEGVSVNPIEDYYHEISFDSKAKEQILNGGGQTTPGYKEGGVVSATDSDPSMQFYSSSEPSLDEMLYQTQYSPKSNVQRYISQALDPNLRREDTVRATPTGPITKATGAVGRALQSAGEFGKRAIEPIRKTDPIKSTVADMFFSIPESLGSALQDWSGAARDATKEQPYRPSPFYGGSNFTANPNSWGAALQTNTVDPRVLDVADMGALAVPVARAAGRAVASGAKELAPTVAQMSAQLLERQGLGPMYVIKEKGGNWIPESIERGINSLKRRPEADIENYENLLKNPDDGWQLRELYTGRLENARRALHLDKWIDKKLGAYIKNELGTKEDPVRKMHERGVSHLSRDDLEGAEWNSYDLEDRRAVAGFPKEGLGESGKAKSWENLSDQAIDYQPAKFLEGVSFASKLEPNTPVYKYDPYHSGLGFQHMVDELSSALDLNSTLPKSLQYTPKQLDNVTVDQAVERVAKINEWRSAEAEKAERAGMMENLNANARVDDPTTKLSFVDKPGMKWVDIPEVVDEKGIKLCTSIGKAGGWCTAESETAKRYGSGERRLVAMLDTDGRPHAQAMIVNDLTHAINDKFLSLDPAEQQQIKIASEKSMDKARQIILDRYPELQSTPPDIKELKPPENDFSKPRAQEYTKRDPEYKEKVTQSVLKFLNSQEWGSVYDLQNFGIYDLKDPSSVFKALARVSSERDIEKGIASFNAAVERTPNAPRFVDDKGIEELLKPEEVKVRTQLYAKGGTVSIDDMRYAIQRNK